MPAIHRLPADLINHIAAGEVVERPASVVKELVENAIDAGARSIDIAVAAAGRELIAVSDDGIGMTPDDARLAFEHHATSKLGSLDDLNRIGTLGFRGEALPSIAAVARVRVTTTAAGSASGVELLVEGGAIHRVREIGGPKGTTVEVRDLFFNTPARKKFLRAPATELGKIQEMVTEHALIHPAIAFRLMHQQRELLRAPAAATVRERVAQLFGVEWAAGLLDIDGTVDGLTLRGLISAPPASWSHRRFQHWSVNRRPIHSQLLNHALYEGYLSLLRRGQHPAALLQLTLDPAQVDVNVHPAKLEVRFARPQQVHTLVRDAVADRIGHPARPAGATPLPDANALPSVGGADGQAVYAKPGFAAQAGPVWSREPATDYPHRRAVERDAQPEPAAPSLFATPIIEPLGQLYRTYIVAVVEGTLEIIDQHAAHERWLFEALMAEWTAALETEESSAHRPREAAHACVLATQPRLVPHTILLPAPVVTRLADRLPLLARLGLECEPFGRDAVIVRSAPAILSGVELGPFLTDLAEEWMEQERETSGADSRRLVHATAATMACHGAIKANQPLSREEMAALLTRLQERPLPPTCPHGRPLRVSFDRAHLEKLFHRR
ncbi:MAG TPA: DNA mismatch repair endonuclease MutL [Nitrospiria bacterium]|nr:DNA mismatch repair endonuclease MutL [Nitrospiria bacterium]